MTKARFYKQCLTSSEVSAEWTATKGNYGRS